MPQCRTRLFLLCMRRPFRSMQIANYVAFFLRVTSMLQQFQSPLCSLEEVLLPQEHPWVTAELRRRAAIPPKEFDSSTMNNNRAHWARSGFRWHSVSMPRQEQSAWFKTLPARERDMVTLATWPGKSSEERARRYAVDVGQSIGRVPHATQRNNAVIAPTLLPGSKLWMPMEKTETELRLLLALRRCYCRGGLSCYRSGEGWSRSRSLQVQFLCCLIWQGMHSGRRSLWHCYAL